MIKKICALLLVLSLTSGLAGCGKKGTVYEDTQPKNVIATDERHADKVIENKTFDIDYSVPNALLSELSIDPVFTSNMVLQRKTVNIISGKTTAKNVAVMYKDGTYCGSVTEDGEWSVYLPPMEASDDNYRLTVYTESGKLSLNNVCVGEVILFGGQSNMQITMAQFPLHLPDITTANDPYLRLFDVKKVLEDEDVIEGPVDVYRGTNIWTATSPDTVMTFSAFGYMYGKKMREELGIPVGLIAAAIGGSGICYWLPDDVFKALQDDGKYIYSAPTGVVIPSKGYNGMIYPIRNLKISSVVWYQGETDAMFSSRDYDVALEKLIGSWRDTFDCPDMRWTLIGLPRWESAILGYAAVRTDMQNIAAADDYVISTVNVDNGDWTDIHPQSKTLPANRAAEDTLYNFYGKDGLRYPILRKVVRLAENKLRLDFSDVGRGIELRNGSKGFEISGDGLTFSDITSNIEAKVSSDKRSITISTVANIAAIRYAVNPSTNYESTTDVSKQVTVFNSAGLPLDQFIWTDAEL